MNYKEVLEKQIERVEEVQEQVLKGIIDRKENAAYTQTTLSLIANTSTRIESLVLSLVKIKEKETAANGSSNDQNHEK